MVFLIAHFYGSIAMYVFLYVFRSFVISFGLVIYSFLLPLGLYVFMYGFFMPLVVLCVCIYVVARSRRISFVISGVHSFGCSLFLPFVMSCVLSFLRHVCVLI